MELPLLILQNLGYFSTLGQAFDYLLEILIKDKVKVSENFKDIQSIKYLIQNSLNKKEFKSRFLKLKIRINVNDKYDKLDLLNEVLIIPTYVLLKYIIQKIPKIP